MAKSKITKQTLIDFFTARGWTLDRWGHLQKEVTAYVRSRDGKEPVKVPVTRDMRIKLQATSCRIEVKTHYKATEYSPARNEWIRVGGAYYKAIVQLEDRGLFIGSHKFPAKE